MDGKSLPASVLTIRTTLVNRRQVCAHVPRHFKSCLDLLPRQQVGSRYRLLKVLGHGSFSCVTLAEDIWTGEHVRSHMLMHDACMRAGPPVMRRVHCMCLLAGYRWVSLPGDNTPIPGGGHAPMPARACLPASRA